MLEKFNIPEEGNNDENHDATVTPERAPSPEDFGIQDTKGFWEIIENIKQDKDKEGK